GSASPTSMITPPLSISARPPFTRPVPTSAIRVILVREEGRHLVAEAVTRLDEDEVAAVRQHHRALVGNRGEVGGADRPGDEVVLARDRQRRGGDPRQVGAKVEAGQDLLVE